MPTGLSTEELDEINTILPFLDLCKSFQYVCVKKNCEKKLISNINRKILMGNNLWKLLFL